MRLAVVETVMGAVVGTSKSKTLEGEIGAVGALWEVRGACGDGTTAAQL